MAVTANASALNVQQWDKTLWREYVRDSGFKSYMGDSNIIIPKRQLVDGGQVINIPFTPKLVGDGVLDANVLRGNEEAITFYNDAVTVRYLRHAVSVTRQDIQFYNFDLRAAARGQIKDWAINRMRQDIIHQLLAIRASTGSGINSFYGKITSSSNGPVITAANSAGAVVTINGESVTSASEADKDTWLTANADRVLFGALRSNASSNDHSTSLGNVDTTADTMRVSIVELAKRMAKQANPQIKPLRVDSSGREFYVMFMPTRAMRDLRNDTTLQNFNVNARPRTVEDNPIFNGGDMLLDNVLCVEIPELPIITAVGASTADVAPCFLCGQEALGYALGEDFNTIADQFDYEFEQGISSRELRAFKKLHYNGIQHGVVTAYVAASADA